MKIKSCLRGIGFGVAALTLILSPCMAHAACEIVGTIDGGYIVACTGMDTDGFCIGDGNDIITVESGAEVSYVVQEWLEELASALAITIDAGGGNNEIANQGSVEATADAIAFESGISNSTATSKSTAIKSGDGADQINNISSLNSTAKSDSEFGIITVSEANAIGIDAGGNKDQIDNTGAINSVAEATARLTDPNFMVTEVHPPRAMSFSTGVEGGDGEDKITNSGITNATAISDSSSLEISLSLDSEGGAISEATAQGIRANESDDTVVNIEGAAINARAEANARADATVYSPGVRLGTAGVPTAATASATGIDGGAGADTMTNDGAITVDADSDAYTGSGSVILVAFEETAFASTTSSAIAVGMQGDVGNDKISNTGTINLDTVTAVSVSNDVDVSMINFPIVVKPSLRQVADAKTEAEAEATGIDGGAGDDDINNTGTIDIYAFADADSNSVKTTLSITASPKASVSGTSVESSPLVASGATAAPLTAAAAQDSTAGSENRILFPGGIETNTIAQAFVTGIAGGEGEDEIANEGNLILRGESDADSVVVSPTINIAKGGFWKGNIFNLLPGAAVADSSTSAGSEVTGLDGNAGNDTLENKNTGEVGVQAVSNSTSADVAVLLKELTTDGLSLGVTISKSTTDATAIADGIAGGEGEDEIDNAGKITVEALADADSASISATLNAAKEGLVAGLTYVDATTKADATAFGIEGGADKDRVTNVGEIDVTAQPTSSSASVGVTLEGTFSQSQEPSAVLGVAITDGKTEAISNATGIAGDEGEEKTEDESENVVFESDDEIINWGSISVNSLPDADSVSVSVTLTGVGDGLAAGLTYADNATTAEADAAGIDGGRGNDTITNTSTGQINVAAQPTSSSASVGVTLEGAFSKKFGAVVGGAMTDGTTTAIADIAGIRGGEGDDTITNSGAVTATSTSPDISDPDAESGADSASVSVDLGGAFGELGLVGGFTYANAETTAEATAVGIDGGEGNDTIKNLSTGQIDVTAQPTSSSASVGVTAKGVTGLGAAVGASLTDGTTKAISTATGIDGGGGEDKITNEGTITVKALPDADSASVSVSLSAANEGVAVGGTFADATTTAQGTAAGIDGGEGQDEIFNSGRIEVKAQSESSSASVSVSAEGTMTGAALGVALSDGTTKAISNAAGIKGGGGSDNIESDNITTVESISDVDAASVSVNLGGAETGLVAGVAAADITTTAESAASGISGGSGDDTVKNWGLTTVTATSTNTSAGVTVNAGFAVNGAAVGAALADGRTVATSTAVGVEGGDGNDTVTNYGWYDVNATSNVTGASVAVNLEATSAGLSGGASLVDGENWANASAIGISGGSGDDTIRADFGALLGGAEVTANTTSTRTNVSVTGNFSLFGAAAGASFADASNVAAAEATSIEGGEGNDEITNFSYLRSDGTTTADTTSVTVDVNLSGGLPGLGVSMASAETTGSHLATGISGGEGDDQIENLGDGVIEPTSTATAKAKAISVDISIASFSTADVTTTASAGSSGITGGSGLDEISNEGIINLYATSTGDGAAGTGTLTGYGAANVNVNSRAITTGIDGGTEDDTIVNRNKITTDSKATAKGRSVSVNLLGAVSAEGGTNAHALTDGLSGSAGADEVTNEGSIDLTATSTADLTGVSVTLLGYSNSDGSSLSEAIATGIDGGDGEDTLTNTSAGSIKATTTAYADTASVSVNLAGAVKADAGSTASATSIGIAGGKEKDTIGNEGDVTLNATSDIDASATDVTLIGYGDSNAKAVSAATVKGIDGGDGANTITNSSTGVITGTAKALPDASSYDIQLSGGGKAKAGTEATATAIGITGGKDMDTIRNEGTINFTAQSTLVSETRSYKLFGTGIADADSKAESFAKGVDGGDGTNTIINASTGSITVASNASATTTSATATIGVAGASASTTSKAYSTGVRSGDDQDTILNEGNISVTATSKTEAAEGTLSLVGFNIGDSLTEVVIDGINAGGGDDWIMNTGTGSITVGSVQNNEYLAYSELGGASAFGVLGISLQHVKTSAISAGISGGKGDDTILNAGTITVGDDDWMAKSKVVGALIEEMVGVGTASSRAEASSIGIDGDDGQDTIVNEGPGILIVKATSNACSDSSGSAFIGLLTSVAAAQAEATATGIDAGNGQNQVTNEGKITADSIATVTAFTDTDTDIGETKSETKPLSKAFAFGIVGGDGGNTVINSSTGAITGTAQARTYDLWGLIVPRASADEIAIVTMAEPATATSMGISLGDGNDIVTNDGSITMNSISDVRVKAHSNSYPSVAEAKATARSHAVVKGIAAEKGENQIENRGQIYVNALGNAEASADSFSRDETSSTEAHADAQASAIGVEGDGEISNLKEGSIEGRIEVKARATTRAKTVEGDEPAQTEAGTATANLRATATGIGTASDIIRAEPDRIWNDGTITVVALTGEDGEGNPEHIAEATVDTVTSVNQAEARGASVADAAGIRVGNNNAEITNTGDVIVLGRTHAHLFASADENATANAGSANDPITSIAKGISLGSGDDTVINAGLVTVDAQSNAESSALSDSVPNTAKSVSNAYGKADAWGIVAGEGSNWVENSGQLNITALADANTEANSYSSYSTSSTEAKSDAQASATGVQGNGEILNLKESSISVKAQATTSAITGYTIEEESENTTATAKLTATATGITTASDNTRPEPDRISNEGSIRVEAVTGDDSNGYAAYAWVDTDDRDNKATAKGGADVDAAGIGVGDNGAEITNTSELKVIGKARVRVFAHSDSGSVAVIGVDADTAVQAETSGIVAGNGNNTVTNTNSGSITVESEATTYSYSEASDKEVYTSSTTQAGGSSVATGIKVGDGQNTVSNHGALRVTARSTGEAFSFYDDAHLDDAYAYAGAKDTSLTATAVGISSGNGRNVIENHQSMTIMSFVTADSKALSNTSYADTFTGAQAGGHAQATGIIAGEGQNLITNYQNNSITVYSDAQATAWAGAEEVAHADVGSAAEAIAISVGNGVNEIINEGELTVSSYAFADAFAGAGDWSHSSAVSNATATGIRTGDGDNKIVNNGELTVNSRAESEATAGSSIDTVTIADAIGIQTGNGDDFIINDGSIVTRNIKNGVSSSGVAISSGAGNDQVFLMDSSQSDGQINLGDGDDWLTMMGVPLVAGNITGATGTDTLVFEGAGSIGFTAMAFENAVKQGSGTYSVTSLPTMQRIEVNQGTLQINNDYAMANDSTFQTNVNGDGSHGQLKVNGKAQLAGDLKVIKGPGPYTNGTTYDIMEAVTLNGLFSNVMLPTPTPLLSFEMNQLPNFVEIETSAKNFTTVANNQVHWIIANYLDRVMPLADGDLSYVLGEIQNLSEPEEFDTAFSSLSPDSYDNFTRATFGSTWQYIKSLRQRMNTVRSYSSTASSDLQTKPVLLAYSGSDASLGQFFTPGQLSQVQGKNGLWFNAYGQWGDQDEDDGFTGFDYDMWGTTLGFDYTFSDKLMAGLSLGYSGTDIDLDGHLGDGDIGSLFGSLYGSYFNKSAYIEAAFSYGRNWYENSRLVMIGPIQRRASSEHDGDAFSGYLGAGYYFNLKDWALLGPFGSLRYIYLDEESFRETGADSVSLWVDSRKTDSLVSELGLQVTRAFGTKYGSLIPQFSAAWSYDFDIDDRVITTSFAGSPGAEFSLEGQDVEKHGAILGAGLTFIHQSGFSTSLRYSGEFRSGYASHGVIGELRYTF